MLFLSAMGWIKFPKNSCVEILDLRMWPYLEIGLLQMSLFKLGGGHAGIE
jgi:hypothetical protein